MNAIRVVTRRRRATLVLGGTGKTGRRVAERLWARGYPIRIGSRAAAPAFDWHDPATWGAALRNIEAAYVSYSRDLAAPGAAEAIGAFAERAVACGVRRLVLLSGRGEQEAQRSEQALQASAADWTILRSSWFCQNFSETFLRDALLDGRVALPIGDVTEPFVDADDVADAAVAALTDDAHVGRLYELTGPRLLTFSDAIAEIADASGRQIDYTQGSPEEFAAGLRRQDFPADHAALVTYLFTTVLDGRNSRLTHGVQHALGREPRDFTDYVRATAATGAWDVDRRDGPDRRRGAVASTQVRRQA